MNMKGKIKTFSTNEYREFVANRPSLKELLKDLL